ncbi:MAG: DUF433 domain-containing protein [Nostoc sp.]|uniref:DUF433 domain-containing protein n=1 Tax=Nostoc sp. TaxID=1180 RepID=UPI002FF6231E
MQKIVSDPKIIMGKPVILGTRITVELILEKLAAGETSEQILEAHLRLRGCLRSIKYLLISPNPP